MDYDSYSIRVGKDILETQLERDLMGILMKFGESVDPQGYDGGNYTEAMQELLALIQAGKVYGEEINE